MESHRSCHCVATVIVLLFSVQLQATTWRIGDADHPWHLHPVSFVLTTGEIYQPQFDWGGSFAAEVIVDDDGDGLIDEDPVDRIDNDGDYLWNEDPVDGVDNDLDGLIDEDGPDAQQDNDGDGLLNEDGLHTGGPIYSPAVRESYTGTPFFRYRTADEAATDAEGWNSGFGWGDDDADARFNEDPINGVDDDLDGLVDEDDAAPAGALPTTWLRSVFIYDADALSPQQRQDLRFVPIDDRTWQAETEAGAPVIATLVRSSFRPTDWIRSIRLDSTRNVARLTDDRFLAGLLSEQDPLQLGTQVGTPRFGDSGNGQVVDGSIITAKSVVGGWSFGTFLNGLFWLDRIRYYPRPNFIDRTPANFSVSYGGDDPRDFRTTSLGTQLVASRFLIPLQIDRYRPVIKDFRLDPPQKVRTLNLGSRVAEGDVWEIAEAEYFGHGYALDASYYSEIVDVGPTRPRVRRYFDADEPWRSIPLEFIRTVDTSGDGSISLGEEAGTKAAAQFDPEAPGESVSWGHVRWHGERIGTDGNVQIRVRTGSSLDPRIYQRRVGPGVVSSFIEAPILFDWPARGSRLDTDSYLSLSSVARAPYKELPANLFGNQDGAAGGWTPWSAPLDFDEGAVQRDGTGGLLLSLPPLMRYVQFRVDFSSTETSGVRLDYLEFDYARPLVGRGVLAEVFPDTAASLGEPMALQYVLRPTFNSGSTTGFNRMDISVPTVETQLDSLLFDGGIWQPVAAVAPVDIAARSTWLDTVTVAAKGTYAHALYHDAEGNLRLGIKTASLTDADFPRGQDRELRVFLRTSLFNLLTRFDSWVWHDALGTTIPQPTSPGDAADDLPSDGVAVIVAQSSATIDGLQVTPNPFTPNGDGLNDDTTFDFSLMLFLEDARLEIDIISLAGTSIRQIGPAHLGIGRHDLRWDGRDDSGQLVPPGLYIYRVTAFSDGDNETHLGVVGVAY
jgi:hypothetical protein